MTDPELLTPDEVAKMLRVHQQTLRRWRADMEGPPFVILSERIIRYPAEGLRDWVDSNWRTVNEANHDL
jgi:hypothetical protein